MSYNPIQYWSSKGDAFKERLNQERILLNKLKSLPLNSILEFGCGYGRLTELIKSNFRNTEYTGFDMSQGRVEYTKFRNPELEIRHNTIEEFARLSKLYDIVFGVEVLMHIPPEQIEKSVQQLMSCSNRYFINIDFYTEDSHIKLSNHNFLHRYGELLGKYGKVETVKINDLQTLFLVDKNE